MEKKTSGTRGATGRREFGGGSQGRSLRKGLRSVSGPEAIGRSRRRGRGGGGDWREWALNWLKGLGDALWVGFG